MQKILLFFRTHRLWPMLPCALVLVCMTSACALGALPGFGPFTGYTDLAQSVLAMGQVHTMHVTEQMTTTTHLRGTVPQFLPQDSTVVVSGIGDEALPIQGQEQAQFEVKMPPLPMPLVVKQVYANNRLYLQPMQGQWLVVTTAGLPRVSDLFQAIVQQNLDVSALAQLFGQFPVADQGNGDTLGGQPMHHLTITITTNGVKQLLSLSKPKTASEQQMLSLVKQDLQSAQGTIDLWIDPTTHLIHRVGLSVAIQALLESTLQPASPTAQAPTPLTVSTTIQGSADLSAFNQPVKVATPQNATLIQLPGNPVH